MNIYDFDECVLLDNKGMNTVKIQPTELCIGNYEPQTESYYTDATHFGKAKGESTTTNTADTPQTESTGSPIGDYRDGIGAWQTDCGWK